MKLPTYMVICGVMMAMPSWAFANGLPKDEPDDGYAPPPKSNQQGYPAPAPQPVYVAPPVRKAPADWYAGVYGGANFQEDWSTSFGPFSIDSNTDTGAVVGVFVGKRIPSIKGLSFEVEANFRDQDTSPALTIVAPPPVITFTGDDRTIALLANARYEFDLGGKVTPYILAGVGYGERTLSVDLVPVLLNFEQSKSDVVWQAGAGLDFNVTEHTRLGVGYRYFDAPDFDTTIFGVVPFNGSGQNHAVVASLTFALN
jgi:opacity protein-like surface antigen